MLAVVGAPRTADKPLEPRERRFVEEYLVDRNGTQAAMRAGYSKNPGSARTTASRLLAKANVAARLRARVEEQLEQLKLQADRVLKEALAIATADPARAIGANGAFLDVKQMPEDLRSAIASVEMEQLEVGDETVAVVRKLRFHPKLEAVKVLAQHAGLLRGQVDVNLRVSLEDLLTEAKDAAQ
jgi:phage terminase small subunit